MSAEVPALRSVTDIENLSSMELLSLALHRVLIDMRTEALARLNHLLDGDLPKVTVDLSDGARLVFGDNPSRDRQFTDVLNRIHK